MLDCSNMKKGDSFYCEVCNFEFQITNDCNCTEENTCKVESNCCDFDCCGKQMLKK